jgi:adenosylmethionine-8-amino-7-oxononanoate aminotransferase
VAPEPDDYSLTASPGRRLPIAVRAEGCRIWDRDGREYLDACGGAMVMTLGHRHPRLIEAARRQLDQVTFTYRFSFGNEPMLELAELLRDVAPMERAWSFFNSSGSESIESAIHLALLYWQHLGEPSKVELVSRYPSFHGSTFGALGLSGSKWRGPFDHLLDNSPVAQAPNADIRARRTQEAELAFGLQQIEAALLERGPENVAAVFLEPISGASGAAIVPPDGYLQGVRDLCDRYRVLLICDETITGFGRTGTWWGCDHWAVAPDIVTFAKGVTSGVIPFSGLVVSGAVADVFMAAPDGFPFGHTFSGNPLGCAVAAETIRVLRDERLVERSADAGVRLRAGLEQIADRSPHIGAVRGRGMLQGLELVADRETLQPLPGGAAQLTGLARERDLLIYSCATPLRDQVVQAVLLAPPLVTSDTDLDAMVERLSDAVGELAGS